jgi:phage minor structural protein GP20|nr:MAG TPA: minor structural protein [Caudoviricetes sp.]DAN54167.1 MAG TPA: minor structural protein [Caudoviricetes sp.]
MNKEDLLKLGLTEEQAEKVLSANTEQLKGFIPKARFDEVNNAKKQAEKDLSERDKQLETLKNSTGDVETLKNTIKQLQDENKASKEQYEANISKIKLDNAIDNALGNAKAKNSRAVRALLDMEKIKFENETLSGLDEQLKALKEAEDSKFLFEEIKEPAKPSFSGVEPGASTGETNPGTGAPETYSQMMARLG